MMGIVTRRRRQRELVCCVLLLAGGMLTLLHGPHLALWQHAPTASSIVSHTLLWQGAAQGAADVQPIPDSALPACTSTVTIPFGPSICVDPVYWVVHGVAGSFNWVVNWIISMFTGFLQGLVAHDLLFDTPTAVTTQNHAVSTLFDNMRAVANAAFALITLMAGFNLMIGPSVGMRREDVKEFLPRLLLGALGANLALWLIGQAVDGTNDFMHAGATAPFRFFVPNLATLPAGTNSLFIGLFGNLGIIVYEVLFLILVFQIFTRLALLDFLIVIAPLAIVCWILPQTRRAAEWWLGLLCATLILQPLQLLLVSMGLTLASNLTTGEGFWGIATILLQIGLLIATLYLAVRLPVLLHYGLFRTVGGVGSPLGFLVDIATALGGIAIAGFTGGAATAATASVAPGGGLGPGVVAGGGSPPASMVSGPGGGGGTPGLPPPGAGGTAYYDPGFASTAGYGPYGGGRYGSGADADATGRDDASPPDSGGGPGGDDPRPGAGTIIDTDGFAIFDDGGPL